MTSQQPLQILVITSRPLLDGAGNPIALLDVAEERRRIRAALEKAGVAIDAHCYSGQARGQNAVEVADYFAVLRGLLLGEDVTDKIAALPEPLRRIAEEAQIKIREIEVRKP